MEPLASSRCRVFVIAELLYAVGAAEQYELLSISKVLISRFTYFES